MADVTWDFSGRAVAITGSAAGIGAGAVAAFGAAGATVYALDVDEEAGRAAVAGVDGAEFLRVDVTDRRSVTAAFDHVDSRGGLDVLVNNAGGFWEQHTMESVGDDEWDRIVDLNLKGVFLCSQAAIPLLRRSTAGRIITMSSLAGQTAAYRSSPPYAAAKAGVLALTRVMALELAGEGITSNAIAPTAVLTERIHTVRSPEERSRTAETIPLGRYGEIDEIVAVMMFLASEEAGFITGETVSVNGGRFMA